MQASNRAVTAMLNNSKQDVAGARQQLSQLRIASEQDKLFVQVLEVRVQQCKQAYLCFRVLGGGCGLLMALHRRKKRLGHSAR